VIMAEVELWLHPDIFYYGVVYAHPKLSVPYLKKVIAYARSKGVNGGYPNLSWPIWKHMAVNKMLMADDLAWAYFEMFHNLRDITPAERIEQAENEHQSIESGDSLSHRQFVTVPTLEFVLFLYLQQSNKMSLRKSVIADEWPGNSPRSMEGVGSKSEVSTNMDEHKHTSFVQANLSQILELLSECFKGEVSVESTLHGEVVKALGYIVKGKVSKQTNVLSIYELAVKHRIQAKSGFMKATGNFSIRTFDNWFHTSLTQNPFGLSSCITAGEKLKWITASLKHPEQTRKKPRIVTNTSTAPAGHKVVFFTQCSNQTIARQTETLNGNYVKIHRCHKAYFYLLSPLKCVSIEKCTGSTFTLGPVATCVRIVSCQNIVVVAPCRSIMITGSENITIYLTTPTNPIISCDNVLSRASPPVTFAPYNTFYPDLERHLADVGLTISPQTDKWNSPICVGNLNNLALNASRTNSFFTIMSPSDFYLFAIPFKFPPPTDSHPPTTEVPGGLPAEYSQAVKSKQRAIERWKRALKDSSMTKDERHSFQLLVEEKFKEWLSETGNQQQLDDL
uniref:TBCC domain-containing protein 1 n=1 Tax=Ciona savignyi TaxID=51511 RepID=H2ZPA7_CIOSA